MAATYSPTRQTARDRVRFSIADKAAAFRFQDEEIAAELGFQGFGGDPSVNSTPQPIPEVRAAIVLLESLPQGTSTSETSMKLGDQVFTSKGSGLIDTSALLDNLRNRLETLLGIVGDGEIVVLDGPNRDDRACYLGFPHDPQCLY